MNQMMSTLWSQLDFVCRISISLSEGASDMLTATTLKVVLGSIAFVVFWVLAVFPAVPILPIGRTAGSILGAVLMVIFQVETPNQAYAAVDLPILGLLFGTMVVSVYLERADMFKYLGKFMSWKSKGAKDLLCRICLVSAVSSALFTNDTTCVVLTEFVLKLALQHNLPPQPLLFALVSSSNIGSAATPIGNPQNLVIAVESGISFGSFLFGVLPAMVVGISVNTLLLLLMYWKPLSCPNPNKVENVISNPNPNSNSGRDDVTSHRFSTATLSRPTSLNSQEWSSVLESMSVHSFPNIIGHTGDVEALRNRVSVDSNKNCGSLPSSSSSSEEGEIQQKREETGTSTRFLLSLNGLSDAVSFKSSLGEKGNSILAPKWKRIVWKCCIYLVVVGMLIALLMGLNMSWTAITAALALVVLDFKDAKPCLEKVSYSLLIFFSGMFITMDGLNKTGIPSELWELMEPYARINKASGVAVLALVILVLSNFASNVPTVLLLGGRIAASATVISPTYERKAWLLLAWVSSVGGNLSLLGSAANLIVCEQAGRAQHSGYNLSFWSHLKFGVPSTLIVTSIGLLFIKG